jgi:hypothetical protein
MSFSTMPIDAPVPRIEHDDRAGILALSRLRWSGRRLGLDHALGSGFPERVPVGPRKLDCQDGRTIGRVRLHRNSGDEGRLREIHDHARSAWREQAVAEGGNQPLFLATRFGRQVKGQFRKVDDHPVRPLHDRRVRRNRLREDDRQGCLRAV